ncbi:protein trichome birefringence-like 20 isoform X8 [Medicago truncatula]|uniref:protein trichome birefringence-like 20 isoform X8 n=1 Tax=Medicago truncatula TaxID=3880 RepID=UPI000D2F31FA|nr:protein trichome birefringence-like 20 isoform X8 [Medicago truncatula]
MITIINTFKEKLTKTFVPSIFYSLLPLALVCLYFYFSSFAPFYTPITHQPSLSISPHLTKVSIINEELNGGDEHHTSSGGNSTEVDPISIINEKLNGGDGHHTFSGGNFTEEDPNGRRTSSSGNFTKEDPISIINEILNGGDRHHTSPGGNFTEEDPNGPQTSSNGNFTKQDPSTNSIINEILNHGDGHHTSSSGNFTEENPNGRQTSSDGNFTKENPISIINEILIGGDRHHFSSSGNFTEENLNGRQTSYSGNFTKDDPISFINEKLNGGDGRHTSSGGNSTKEEPISITNKKLNGRDEHQTTFDGNFTKEDPKKEKPLEKSCDYLIGNWVHDKRGPLYNGTTCNEIRENQNCIVNGRPDTSYLYWRWKPNECDLPIFDPNTFLKLMSNMNIVFVGDSLSRNQLESLICLLSTVSKPKYINHIGSIGRWYFPSYNANLTSYWAPFLVKGDQRRKEGPNYNTIHLDHVSENWAKDIDQMDLIMLSFGHWFLDIPSVYYENDSVIGCSICHDLKSKYNDIGFYVPMRKALRIALNTIIERKMVKGNEIDVIVRTFSPTHFEGSWDKGGTCSKKNPYKYEEKKLEGMEAKIRSMEIEEAENAKEKSKQVGLNLKVLDITKLALLRPDGHAGAYRYPFPFAKTIPKNVQNDCTHWCLPGPIDTWNEIFLEMMKKGKNY